MSEINISKSDNSLNRTGQELADARPAGIDNFQAAELQSAASGNIAAEIRKQVSASASDASLPQLVLSDEKESQGKIEPGDYSKTMTVDGETRSYHIHVPPNYDASRPVPLVLVLHGHGDSADSVARISGMDEESDKKGFIVAYPEAIHWLGDRGMAAWDTDNGLLPPGASADDTGFLRRVIDKCQQQFTIDPDQTYLVGFSNGGMEAYKAASELSDKLAAVVAVSGAMSGKEARPELPVSLYSIVGTGDPTVPQEGRTQKEEAAAAAPDKMRMLEKMFPILKDDTLSPLASEILQWVAVQADYVPEFKPVTYATDFWKKADGISTPGVITHEPGITSETYTNPENGVAVKQEIVDGGDHMIQHGAPANYNLSDDIWNFLSEHPRKS